jgi:phytanoyl-CoA hydroxylase
MQARETLREAFDRDGFVHVEAFMSQQEMDEIEAHLARFIRDVVPSLPKPEAMHEDYDDPASLKQIPQLNAHDAFFAELLAHPKVVSLARDLLQDDVVPQNVEYFSKPPGRGKPTPPHQDGYYFCLVPNEALTVWIAFDDIDEENGALYYVAGSRQKGVLPHGASHVLGFSQGLTAGATSEFGREVLCRVKRGDCLVHHSLTIHAAGGNPSARKRRALGLIYYAQRAKVDPELRRRYQESLASQRKDLGVA